MPCSNASQRGAPTKSGCGTASKKPCCPGKGYGAELIEKVDATTQLDWLKTIPLIAGPQLGKVKQEYGTALLAQLFVELSTSPETAAYIEAFAEGLKDENKLSFAPDAYMPKALPEPSINVDRVFMCPSKEVGQAWLAKHFAHPQGHVSPLMGAKFVAEVVKALLDSTLAKTVEGKLRHLYLDSGRWMNRVNGWDLAAGAKNEQSNRLFVMALSASFIGAQEAMPSQTTRTGEKREPFRGELLAFNAAMRRRAPAPASPSPRVVGRTASSCSAFRETTERTSCCASKP